MEVQITNHSKFQDLSGWDQSCNTGLDWVWKEPWLARSLQRRDAEILPDLERIAQEMCQGCDHILVVCEPMVGKAIAAALALMADRRDTPEVTVFPATLSPVDYDVLFGRLARQRVRLLAIACQQESLALRGTYAILKQFVFGQRQPVASPVYTVVEGRSQTIAQDSRENDYPQILLEDDLEAWSLANSPALLLPLLLAGGDGKAYLEGFREAIESPKWDRDATIFAKGRAQARAEKMPIRFRVWQRELEPMASFLASGSVQTRESKSAVWMPEEACSWKASPEMTQTEKQGRPCPEALLVDLSLAEGPVDLMTPAFEGCHPDGSLALLLQERIPQEAEGAQAIHLAGDGIGAKAAGAWMAFCQVSEGIVRKIP